MRDSLFPDPPNDGPYARQTARARAVAGCDVTARKHGDNENSTAAHEAVFDSKEAQYGKILNFLRGEGERGGTAQEIAFATWLPYTSVSARCSELLDQVRVRRSGEKRNTTAGRSAAVLVLV